MDLISCYFILWLTCFFFFFLIRLRFKFVVSTLDLTYLRVSIHMLSD